MFRRDVTLYLNDILDSIEVSSHIPETVKVQSPAIEWRLFKDFRNFIVHEWSK